MVIARRGCGKGEILEEALIREVKEETGLTAVAGGLVAINEKFFEESGNHALFLHSEQM